jgi:hypothetical protein
MASSDKNGDGQKERSYNYEQSKGFEDWRQEQEHDKHRIRIDIPNPFKGVANKLGLRTPSPETVAKKMDKVVANYLDVPELNGALEKEIESYNKTTTFEEKKASLQKMKQECATNPRMFSDSKKFMNALKRAEKEIEKVLVVGGSKNASKAGHGHKKPGGYAAA